MNYEAKILDHGYLRLVESWGSDERIIEAARMSTQKGFRSWWPYFECETCGDIFVKDSAGSPAHPGGCHSNGNGGAHTWKDVPKGDAGLLKYLYENKHATPFEFAGIVVEVQAPVFVFREWHRHRTQSYNEMSARYAPLPDLNYIPSIERLMRGGGHLTKQAAAVSTAVTLTAVGAEDFRIRLRNEYARHEAFYQESLASGVPKELARIDLPVGRYSRMRASANLRNWLGFMTLRSAPTAQEEIRVYSEAIGALVAQCFPRTWGLFSGTICLPVGRGE